MRQVIESVRHARVAAGLSELERWLDDQARHGIGGAAESDWSDLARRLVDAQAPGVASMVGRLARLRASADWPARLLEQYALIDLLAVAYRARDTLPEPLAQTVLTRVGFTVPKERVLAGEPVRDAWQVVGVREEPQDRLTARRVWLRGHHTHRPALILTYTVTSQPSPHRPPPPSHQQPPPPLSPPPLKADPRLQPDPSPLSLSSLLSSPEVGCLLEGPFAFYPAAAPLRALPHDTVMVTPGGPPPAQTVEQALDEVAGALVGDPWTESWPLVLADAIPERTRLAGLPLHPGSHDPWRLIAVSGGAPVTVSVEWTPQGLIPLAVWTSDEAVAL